MPTIYSPFLKNFIGAAIAVIGLLGATALFGEWGLGLGIIALIIVAATKVINDKKIR